MVNDLLKIWKKSPFFLLQKCLSKELKVFPIFKHSALSLGEISCKIPVVYTLGNFLQLCNPTVHNCQKFFFLQVSPKYNLKFKKNIKCQTIYQGKFNHKFMYIKLTNRSYICMYSCTFYQKIIINKRIIMNIFL